MHTAPLTRRGVPLDPTLRILALGTLVNRAGAGALVTTSALYFTRELGLTAAQVGMALSIGALAGMAAQVPAGHLGDVKGPRGVMRALTVVAGISSLLLLVTRDLAALIAVVALANAAQSGGGAVRNGYIARVAVGGRGVQFKAYLRAVTNVAMAIGAGLGGIALWIDQPWAYLVVFAIDGATSLAASTLYRGLPYLEPAPPRGDGEPRLAVLRDKPYVVVTILSGIVSMHFVVMEVGIPLWISQRTDAPTSMVAALLVLNTVVVALFQVRMTRGTDAVAASAATMRRGGLWIAAAFVVLAFSSGVDAGVAVVVLLLGATVHVVGEMVTSGGQWGVSMGLAPAERQGQYQGFSGLGFGLSNVLAPTLITVLCIEWGRPGWFVMAGLILGAACGMRPAAAWALRTRERYGALTASG